MRITLEALVPTRPALPALAISADDPEAPPISPVRGSMTMGISMRMDNVDTRSIQK